MKQITIKIKPNGEIEAETHGIKGKNCLKYIDEIERLTNAKTNDSSFTPEYFETLAEEDSVFSDYPDEQQLSYIRRLTGLVYEHYYELSNEIKTYAKGWRIDRISKIASTILRCAMCEILYIEDVPSGAAANEAVELAKRYADPETAAFVNGILGSFIRHHETTVTAEADEAKSEA